MGIVDYVHENPGILLAVGWVASAAASALPDPTPDSSPVYIWFHNFTQALMANLPKIKFPNSMPPVPSSPLLNSKGDKL